MSNSDKARVDAGLEQPNVRVSQLDEVVAVRRRLSNLRRTLCGDGVGIRCDRYLSAHLKER